MFALGAIALLTGASLLVLHQVTTSRQARLFSPASDSFGASLPSTRANQPYSFGSIPICVEGAGEVTIDRVTPINPQAGFRISAFATRPLSNNMIGALPTSLANSGFGGGPTVRERCSTGEFDAGSELAIETVKTDASNARADGLTIRWHTNEQSGELVIPFHIALCQGEDESVAACTSL